MKMKYQIQGILFSMLLGSTALTMAQTYQHAPPEEKVADTPSKEWIAKIERLAPAQATVAPAKPRTVLLFSLTTGFQHYVRPYATEVIKALARKTGAFAVVESLDIESFSPENLAKFDAVILNNCCPDAKHRNLFLDVLNNQVDKSIADIGLKYKDLTEEQRQKKAAELTRVASSTCGRMKSQFLSAKVKPCCSEGESPSSLGRKAPEFRTKELDGKV